MQVLLSVLEVTAKGAGEGANVPGVERVALCMGAVPYKAFNPTCRFATLLVPWMSAAARPKKVCAVHISTQTVQSNSHKGWTVCMSQLGGKRRLWPFTMQ